MTNKQLTDFATRLKQLRATAGLTQAALADKSGVPLRTIHQYEGGYRQPSLAQARKLSLALAVSLEAFFDDSETAQPRRKMKQR